MMRALWPRPRASRSNRISKGARTSPAPALQQRRDRPQIWISAAARVIYSKAAMPNPSRDRSSDQAQIREEVRESAEAGREQAEDEREQQEEARQGRERGRDTLEPQRAPVERLEQFDRPDGPQAREFDANLGSAASSARPPPELRRSRNIRGVLRPRPTAARSRPHRSAARARSP